MASWTVGLLSLASRAVGLHALLPLPALGRQLRRGGSMPGRARRALRLVGAWAGQGTEQDAGGPCSGNSGGKSVCCSRAAQHCAAGPCSWTHHDTQWPQTQSWAAGRGHQSQSPHSGLAARCRLLTARVAVANPCRAQRAQTGAGWPCEEASKGRSQRRKPAPAAGRGHTASRAVRDPQMQRRAESGAPQLLDARESAAPHAQLQPQGLTRAGAAGEQELVQHGGVHGCNQTFKQAKHGESHHLD